MHRRVIRTIHLAHAALTNLRADFVTAEFCAGGDTHCFLVSVIKMTSLMVVPRAKAIHFPSRERSKENICSGLKSANCFGAPPSSDWLHRLEESARVIT